jgi:hypothetical protein
LPNVLERPDICAQVADLLRSARVGYADRPEIAARLDDVLERLGGPIRVAIAGKIKAGKSTLLNAMVGEIIAPTDAGECTKIVTWYRDAPVPRITMHRTDGGQRDLPIIREDGKLQIDLDGVPPEQVERLAVDWPSADLNAVTLIDTPGIASTSAEVSARTEAFLTPGSEPGSADAIVYLMRHVHADDVGFLQAFHAHSAISSSPVNTVAVLARADEIGAGRIDALASAGQISRRMRADETIRGLCQTVVPVAGLLAETGRTLRQAEFAALAQIANADRELVEEMLLSADRFVGEFPAGGPELPPAQVRRDLLARLGMFGVRIAFPLIRQGSADAPSLSAELVRRSGLAELTDVLSALFTERAGLLKARSALLALEQIVRSEPTAKSASLLGEIERITAGAHEFVELALLGSLRAGVVGLGPEPIAEAERILGGSGQRPWVRLGLPADTPPAQLRAQAVETLDRWRRRAENPVSVRAIADAAGVVVRTCEGIIASLPPDAPSPEVPVGPGQD